MQHITIVHSLAPKLVGPQRSSLVYDPCYRLYQHLLAWHRCGWFCDLVQMVVKQRLCGWRFSPPPCNLAMWEVHISFACSSDIGEVKGGFIHVRGKSD